LSESRTLRDVTEEIGCAISVLHIVGAVLGNIDNGTEGHAAIALLNTTDELQSLYTELTELGDAVPPKEARNG